MGGNKVAKSRKRGRQHEAMDGEVFVFLIFLSKPEKVPRWPDSSEGKESGAGGTNALGGKRDGSLRLPAALVSSFPRLHSGNTPTGHREPVTWEWQEAEKLGEETLLTEQLAHEEDVASQCLIFPSLERLRARSTGFWKIQLGFLKSSSQLHHEILGSGS